MVNRFLWVNDSRKMFFIVSIFLLLIAGCAGEQKKETINNIEIQKIGKYSTVTFSAITDESDSLVKIPFSSETECSGLSFKILCNIQEITLDKIENNNFSENSFIASFKENDGYRFVYYDFTKQIGVSSNFSNIYMRLKNAGLNNITISDIKSSI